MRNDRQLYHFAQRCTYEKQLFLGNVARYTFDTTELGIGRTIIDLVPDADKEETARKELYRELSV
jgi:hypothetical protein